jgi:hypothetical protein
MIRDFKTLSILTALISVVTIAAFAVAALSLAHMPVPF